MRARWEHRTDSKRGAASHRRTWIVVAAVCSFACLLPSAANAQCSAKEVLERSLQKRDPGTTAAPTPIRSAEEAPAWKTIAIGTFKNSFALRNELDARRCGIGDGAEEMLARPAFLLNRITEKLDLVSVTAEQLGFTRGRVALPKLYARAEQLGLEFAPAEVGPQLRLQYIDQPIGEFLTVGMKPIQTWAGESLVFVIANGGAALLLLSSSADAEIYSKSPVVFVRRRHDSDVALGR